jgi:hypothetical protein
MTSHEILLELKCVSPKLNGMPQERFGQRKALQTDRRSVAGVCWSSISGVRTRSRLDTASGIGPVRQTACIRAAGVDVSAAVNVIVSGATGIDVTARVWMVIASWRWEQADRRLPP